MSQAAFPRKSHQDSVTADHWNVTQTCDKQLFLAAVIG